MRLSNWFMDLILIFREGIHLKCDQIKGPCTLWTVEEKILT